jgi:hypothetical protein
MYILYSIIESYFTVDEHSRCAGAFWAPDQLLLIMGEIRPVAPAGFSRHSTDRLLSSVPGPTCMSIRGETLFSRSTHLHVRTSVSEKNIKLNKII